MAFVWTPAPGFSDRIRNRRAARPSSISGVHLQDHARPKLWMSRPDARRPLARSEIAGPGERVRSRADGEAFEPLKPAPGGLAGARSYFWSSPDEIENHRNPIQSSRRTSNLGLHPRL